MNTLKAISNEALSSLHASFDLLWSKVSHLFPSILFVLAVLSIGLIVADFLSDKISLLIKKSRLDILLDKVIAPTSKLTGVKINVSAIIGATVKWFLTATVALAALDLADLHEVVNFFNQAIGYLPNIFIAALIVIVGSLIANLAVAIIKLISKSEKNGLTTTAKLAVNSLALIAAMGSLATPLIGSLNQLVGHLGLSHLPGDVLFLGILILILFTSKNAVSKTVAGLYKS